jgi:outer membrane biosynthesis protein TonB
MARAELSSLRLSRSDTERLVLALVLSLSVHLAIWGGYETGKKLGWWREWHMPAWLHKTTKKNTPTMIMAQTQPEPMIFVDVTQPDAVPPKKTIYYSDQNSHAANPDEDKNSNQPKLNGKQKVTPKAKDTPRLSKAEPPASPQNQLRPSPEKTATEAENQSSPMNLGDQKLTQLADRTTTEQKPAPQATPRPRTLKQAQEQEHLPGQQMHQNGGAHHHLEPSFDAKATAFGDYDRALIDAIQGRWDYLLDNQQYADDRTGQVTIKFKLEYDGTVRDVEILQNGVGDMLSYYCQAAIQESAPFGKWPDDMRREIGANFREITFTFDYY